MIFKCMSILLLCCCIRPKDVETSEKPQKKATKAEKNKPRKILKRQPKMTRTKNASDSNTIPSKDIANAEELVKNKGTGIPITVVRTSFDITKACELKIKTPEISIAKTQCPSPKTYANVSLRMERPVSVSTSPITNAMPKAKAIRVISRASTPSVNIYPTSNALVPNRVISVSNSLQFDNNIVPLVRIPIAIRGLENSYSIVPTDQAISLCGLGTNEKLMIQGQSTTNDQAISLCGLGTNEKLMIQGGQSNGIGNSVAVWPSGVVRNKIKTNGSLRSQWRHSEGSSSFFTQTLTHEVLTHEQCTGRFISIFTSKELDAMALLRKRKGSSRQ
jgi:hypothetical protein